MSKRKAENRKLLVNKISEARKNVFKISHSLFISNYAKGIISHSLKSRVEIFLEKT